MVIDQYDPNFMGTDETPAIVHWEFTKMKHKHFLNHAHDLDGTCHKNRTGKFCK